MVYFLIYLLFIFFSILYCRGELFYLCLVCVIFIYFEGGKIELEIFFCIGECSIKWYLVGIMIGIINFKVFLN